MRQISHLPESAHKLRVLNFNFQVVLRDETDHVLMAEAPHTRALCRTRNLECVRTRPRREFTDSSSSHPKRNQKFQSQWQDGTRKQDDLVEGRPAGAWTRRVPTSTPVTLDWAP